MVKTTDIKTQEGKNDSIINRIKKGFDKLMDRMSAEANPDKDPKYTNTDAYWENRKRTEEIAATQVPHGDKGIER